jgi:hypothetical protein
MMASIGISEPEFQAHDYAIGGKMVVGRASMSEEFRILLEDGDFDAKKEIKNRLIHQMAEYMLEHNLVEFTYQDDVMGNRNIAVRAYLAPNDQVKILRMANKVI